jgi:release factor glutamine methyltransferase
MTFSGLSLETAPGRVMTPRSTSERLVAEACARVGGPARIADVGTGCGAIAIAIAVRCPNARIWATDIDESAVALAQTNVRRLQVQNRVFVRRCDLLGSIPRPLDLIVANLPYLAAGTAAEHADLRGEPHAAVFVAGDGLEVYRRLVNAARTSLTATGALLLQLHGRVIVAERRELTALRDALDGVDAVRYAA